MYQLRFKKLLVGFLTRLSDALGAVKYSFWIMLLAAGFLLGSLTGCHGTMQVKVLPPVELLQNCVESNIDIRTNGGLAKAVPILRQDLRVCSLDKQALRRWAEE